MKSFGMWKLPMIALGLGAVALLSPTCKAQEVNPDHFTDTGVQDVYENAPAKPVAPKLNQKPAALQAQARHANSPASLQLASKRTAVPPAHRSTKAPAEKRKPAAAEQQKP